MRGPRGCPTPGHHRGDRGNLAVQWPVDTADVATVSRPILQQSAVGDAASISSSCNATAVGCVAMGVKRDPAVRLCVTCVQLESADQFAPGRRKCVACQQTQPSRADCPGRPHDPHAAVRARARDQALRRLGLEHLDAYRTLYQAERRAIPDMVPTARARKQTVSRALRALERPHHSRYVELYQEEFQQARSQPHSRRPGRPAGTSDRLTITPRAASTWRRNGAGRRRPRQQGEGARQRAELQAIQERAPTCSPKGYGRPRSLANSVSPGSPRSGGHGPGPRWSSSGLLACNLAARR